MKQFAATALLLLAQPALAGSVTVFNDPCTGDLQCGAYTSTGSPLYHGGNGSHAWGDVIGEEGVYDTLSLTVTQSGPDLVVSILTRFVLDPFAYPNTGFGDLLLSTTGWHPSGASPYDQDTATTSGTTWNYVVSTQAKTIYHGAALANSDNLTQDGEYRHDQYIGYQQGGSDIGNALVAIDDAVLENVGNGLLDTLGTQLTYSIPLASLGLSPGTSAEVALRWTTTGAHDIVEAAINLDGSTGSVPEPASLPLMLAGLAGWRMSRRGQMWR